MNKNTRGSIILLITALIWGTTFVVQSSAMDDIGPLLFLVTRFFLGGLSLLPVIFFMDKKRLRDGSLNNEHISSLNKYSVKAGFICGLALMAAAALQQYGLITTSAGKAGFITAIYIVLVPIAGFFIGKRIPKATWISVLIAIVGFYLLSIKEGFSIETGDLLCLLCAFGFTVQILLVDHFMENKADALILSCTEFFTVSAVLFFPMLIVEGFHFILIKNAAFSILYCGIMASGVAYTFQVIGQRDTSPTMATLLMSLESVFAALSGWLLLGEKLTLRELAGCILVFIGVIIAQLAQPAPDKG